LTTQDGEPDSEEPRPGLASARAGEGTHARGHDGKGKNGSHPDTSLTYGLPVQRGEAPEMMNTYLQYTYMHTFEIPTSMRTRKLEMSRNSHKPPTVKHEHWEETNQQQQHPPTKSTRNCLSTATQLHAEHLAPKNQVEQRAKRNSMCEREGVYAWVFRCPLLSVLLVQSR